MIQIEKVIQEFKDKSDGKYIDDFLPNNDFIEQYEKKLCFKFPEDYKRFLYTEMNYYLGDLEFFQLTKGFDHIDELLKESHKAWELGVPKHWLAFSTDNGNYFCFDEKGVIHYWSHDGVVDESWPDFKTWLKKVWIEENET